MILIGELSLWVALLMAVWAGTVSFAGGAQRREDLIASGERGIYAALAMTALASLGLWTAIVTHDFSFAFVASFTSANLPLAYALAAFWGGPAGSLLFWALILAGCSTTVVYINRDHRSELMPYVTGTLAAMLALTLLALCVGMNPYERIQWAPLDGRGMSPLLQKPGMLLHPPMLYIGLTATAVPFAFAIATLINRRLDGDWLSGIRRWVLVSWLFLTIGIVLGMWWAYGEAGWGESWTRDPVGNAALFPWVINTVLLHSLGGRGTRGELRKLHVILIVLAFLLSVHAVFVADGGIISSAHTYSQSPVGGWAAGFLVFAIAACGYLAVTRLRGVPSDRATYGYAGAEDRAPSGRLRKLAMALVYAGMIVMLVALAGQTRAVQHDVTLNPGQSRELRDPFGRAWTFTSQGVSQYNELNRSVLAAAVEVGRSGQTVEIVTTEQRQYMDSRGSPTSDPWMESGMLGTITQDIRIALEEVGGDERVNVRISFNPLVMWVWIGGFLLAAGGSMLLLGPAGRSGE
ncbi:MAG: cytochrome c biogenesis protein CcsA [Gemmatimonadaceae bacterium]